MRRATIVTAAVLVCAVALCAVSVAALDRVVAGAEALHNLALQALEEGRTARAAALLEELNDFWRSKARLLEVIVDHEALHEVDAAIAEARICLACGDRDDFLQAMSAAGMGLAHLRDEEALSWENLY